MSAEDLFGLHGKVVLVTGANSGLGFGFASGIAKCGGDVVVWGRRSDKNEEAAERLRRMGARRVSCQSVDVSDETQVAEGINKAIEVMGRIDGVVVNAGTLSTSPLHEMSTATYDEMLAVAQHGGFFTLRESLKHMVARANAGDPGGSLILCGSLSVFAGRKGLAHYGAAKGAMAAMMRSIAVEYGPIGIRANMVCPGMFSSDFLESQPEHVVEGVQRTMARHNPVPRIGIPEDLEAIAAYLMSDSSRYHTGDLIVIDGGRSITTFG